MASFKDNERILKTTREKQVVTYKGAPTRLSSDFSTETFQARREWDEIVKMMKSNDLQPRLSYTARLSFKIEGHLRSCLDKKKLKEFVNTQTVTATNVKGLVRRRRMEEKMEEEEEEEEEKEKRRRNILTPGNQTQSERYTQTQSTGLEKDISGK